jgi:hypothetical protein
MNPSNIVHDSISHYLVPTDNLPSQGQGQSQSLNKCYSKEVPPESMEEEKGSYPSNSLIDTPILKALEASPDFNVSTSAINMLPSESRKTIVLSPISDIDRKKRRVVKKRTPAANQW